MYNKQFTKKEINQGYKNKIRINYCKAQELLKYQNRVGYTAGVYGWNADIYIISDNTVIITGYNAFGNIEDNKKTEHFNNLAKTIQSNNYYDFDKKRKITNKLLEQFVEEVTK